MPGILPMKVIKVGTSAQSRIAQACDRCRSKKIRCDGVRPTCSQCANVGFECRTSDKLSRRAFPRGYTESLEERVRQLENEVKELKDLLDEKDEKIDMLARMHDYRAPVGSAPKPSMSSTEPTMDSASAPKGDVFRVQAAPSLLEDDDSDSYLMGSSSGRALLGTLKRKMQEAGKPCPVDVTSDAFLGTEKNTVPIADMPLDAVRAPPRLFTDRCVNVFFQEWAPLFPVLHKPTFLPIYEEFVAESHSVTSNHKIAQLYLVFGVAALSNQQPDMEHVAACESQWQRALNAIVMGSTLETLQCLTLALMYCSIRKDYKQLQYYKSIAVGLSYRLGLHQSQKRFSFGALTTETRKKVFWTLYTLDCFSSAMLGLPKLLKEDDIHVEYPSDADDEYVTEKGFQPTLPGESTRLSNALALFKISRTLSRVLDQLYPAATSHEISLQQMSALDAELSAWNEKLPSHLKLNFAKDKPSTDITGSRSPLLSLAYNYIRCLVYRPAIGSSLGSKSAPALIAMGESSKHIVQIAELLEERNMSFSFCLPKVDMLVLCGATFLYQGIDLKQDSKLVKEGERITKCIIQLLQKSKAPVGQQLNRIASTVFTTKKQTPGKQTSKSPEQAAAVPLTDSPPTQRPTSSASEAINQNAALYSAVSSSEPDLLAQQARMRRMTFPNSQMGDNGLHGAPANSSSMNGDQQPSTRPDHRFMNHIHQKMMRLSKRKGRPANPDAPSFGGDGTPNPQAASPTQPQNFLPHSMASMSGSYPMNMATKDLMSGPTSARASSFSEWEALVGAMDSGQIYDAIYGGPSQAQATTESNGDILEDLADWPLDAWDLTGISHLQQTTPTTRESVPSLSDESLSSGDDMGNSGDLYAMNNEDFSNALPPQTPQQPHMPFAHLHQPPQQHQLQHSQQQQQQQQRTSIDANGVGLMFDGLELNLGLYE